jgi:hypothetical protein
VADVGVLYASAALLTEHTHSPYDTCIDISLKRNRYVPHISK